VAWLLRVAFPADQARKWLAVITYADDSGSHAGAPAFALAFYAATERRWRKFEREWKAVLKREHLTRFRMSECEAWREEFRQHPPAHWVSVKIELAEIINRYIMVGVGAAYDRDAYRRIVPPALNRLADHSGDPRIMIWENPYVMAFNALVGYVRDRVSPMLRPKERIACVFDRQHGVAGVARDHYTRQVRFRNAVALFDEEPFFRSSIVIVPLQAADMLAYEVMKDFVNREARDERKLLTLLKSRNRVGVLHFGEKELREEMSHGPFAR
jgi:Protein of unknown function (DUF3800)